MATRQRYEYEDGLWWLEDHSGVGLSPNSDSRSQTESDLPCHQSIKATIAPTIVITRLNGRDQWLVHFDIFFIFE